jgi:hypothetical protein
MQSKAVTVKEYLASLPDHRRQAIEAVRRVILDNVDASVREGMAYGMIGYAIPHDVYPAGYHCDPKMPLPYAAIASQKAHVALYLPCVYGDNAATQRIRDAWAKAGKKLDMGAACIRFKKLEDLPLEAVADAIRRTPSKVYIARYEEILASMKSKPRAARKAAPKAKPAAPKAKPAAPKKASRTRAAPRR